MKGGLVPEDQDWRQLQHPALSHGSHSLLLSCRAKKYGGHWKSHYLAVIAGRFQISKLCVFITNGKCQGRENHLRSPEADYPLGSQAGREVCELHRGYTPVQASLPAWKPPQGIRHGDAA